MSHLLQSTSTERKAFIDMMISSLDKSYSERLQEYRKLKRERLNILKNSNDGFNISEEDMRIRGYGDILGFKQSGLKTFKLADPIINENLFILAEKEIKRIENNDEDISRF